MRPTEEPSEVRVLPEYRGVDEEAASLRDAALTAVYRLLAGNSIDRPVGAPDRVLEPGQRIVLFTDNGAVVGRWVET